MDNSNQAELSRLLQLRESGIISEKDYLELKAAVKNPNPDAVDPEFDNNTGTLIKNDINTIKCPRCDSTAITTGARGWKWTTGFIGSGKTVNRCGNCGYTWEPQFKR